MIEAVIDDVPRLPPDALFLTLGGRLISATPRPDIGDEFFLAETKDGLMFLRSDDRIEAVDMTPAITQLLKMRLKDQRGAERRNQIQHRARLKASRIMEPIDHQQKSAPTERVMIELGMIAGERRKQQQGVRRIVDARLWSSLSGDMQDAMVEIEAGYRALTGGMGMKPANLERVSGGRGDMSSRQGLAASAYNAWIEEVDNTLKRDFSHEFTDPRYGKPMTFGRGKAASRWTMELLVPEAATAIICHGQSVRDVASARGKDKAWVSDNLKQALNVWLYRTNRLRRPARVKEEDDVGLTLKQVRIRQQNRRVDRIGDMIDERKRVIRAAPPYYHEE